MRSNQDKREKITMAVVSWNVRTIGDSMNNQRPERSNALVVRELVRFNIDIADLSETRLRFRMKVKLQRLVQDILSTGGANRRLSQDNHELILQLRAR